MSSKNKEFNNRPFDKLKKQLLDRSVTPPPSPPEALPPQTDDELFQDAMSDVQMIDEFRILPCSRSSKRVAPDRHVHCDDADALRILEQIAAGRQPINLSDTQEYMEWTNPDQPAPLIEKLHAGEFSVQGFLDLHGITCDGVDGELDRFMTCVFRNGWRCIKIIHGRGLRSVNGPVLKNAVARRLTGHYRKQVIAFATARQCDGGLGALYVLLR